MPGDVYSAVLKDCRSIWLIAEAGTLVPASRQKCAAQQAAKKATADIRFPCRHRAVSLASPGFELLH
jgi:hypothetical protein